MGHLRVWKLSSLHTCQYTDADYSSLLCLCRRHHTSRTDHSILCIEGHTVHSCILSTEKRDIHIQKHLYTQKDECVLGTNSFYNKNSQNKKRKMHLDIDNSFQLYGSYLHNYSAWRILHNPHNYRHFGLVWGNSQDSLAYKRKHIKRWTLQVDWIPKLVFNIFLIKRDR